jgi:hypothetical protein
LKGVWRGAENGEIKKAIKPLKTNDSAKSRDFALNDFNGLPP